MLRNSEELWRDSLAAAPERLSVGPLDVLSHCVLEDGGCINVIPLLI